jgi:hypothetical protein
MWMQDISRLVYELKFRIIHMNQWKWVRGVRAESRDVSMERTAAMALHRCLSIDRVEYQHRSAQSNEVENVRAGLFAFFASEELGA